MNIIINGTITLRSPLSIKMPTPEGGRENQYDGFPVATVGIDDAGGPIQTGYLPASTIRGFIRREVALAVARARGVSTLPQLYSDILGQRRDLEGEKDLQKLEAIRANDPVLDLFGAWSMRSRLLVSNFMPTVPVLPECATVVRKDLEDTVGVLDMLSEEDRDVYFSRSDANSERSGVEANLKKLKSDLRKAKKAGEPIEEIEMSIKLHEKKVTDLTEEMGVLTESSRLLAQRYELPQGTVLTGRIVIERAKDRDLPMIEGGLLALSLRPILGAHAARGCGEVAGRFEVNIGGRVEKIITTGDWSNANVTEFAGAA
jgi:antitoxin component HigA of HigAB toxin-antitoxin module